MMTCLCLNFVYLLFLLTYPAAQRHLQVKFQVKCRIWVHVFTLPPPPPILSWCYIHVHKAIFSPLFCAEGGGGGVKFLYVFNINDYCWLIVIYKLLYLTIFIVTIFCKFTWIGKEGPPGHSYLVNLFLFPASMWLFSKCTLFCIQWFSLFFLNKKILTNLQKHLYLI